jgi:predicted DNA-binding antitoxin AbrB/MazE fold protein
MPATGGRPVTPITAIYENGVFKPEEPVSLPEGSKVTVTPARESANGPPPDDDYESTETQIARTIEWLKNRTPEEIQRTRDELMRASRPARPLPPGKTLDDIVRGKWPGDETDEQIREALEHLS